MKNDPLISVILPVFNCEVYVEEAVKSILNQTFGDFELIIIDDASTDNTLSLLRKIKDPRINLIEKSSNTGLTNSLNLGLQISRGKFIARMDGDDISHSTRFAKQVAFLDANPDIGVCGTLYKIMGTDFISPHPKDPGEIKVKLISNCYVAHPTVMIRKSVLDLNSLRYDPEMEPAEDYDLWSRLVFFTKISNLDEVLLTYRIHENQVSKTKRERQNELGKRLRLRLLQKLLPDIPDLTQLKFKKNFNFHDLNLALAYLKNLWQANKRLKIFDWEYFNKFIKAEKAALIKIYFEKHQEISLKSMFISFIRNPDWFRLLGVKKSLKFFLNRLNQNV